MPGIEKDREKLLEIQIERVFLKNRGTYGVRRIHENLAAESIRTSLRRVRRTMRRLNLVANDKAPYLKAIKTIPTFGGTCQREYP